MKTVIIAGTTGMVGSIIQRECLDAEMVSEVTSIVRRPSGISHPKLKEIVHQDFLNFSEVKEHFAQKDVAYFCIGVYIGTVPDDKFKIITVDMAQSFADAVMEGNADITFCLLSGAGADTKEKSRVAFARYKGMAENYMIAKKFKHLNIFRPGYIYPVEKRVEPNLMYRVSRSLYPLLKNLMSGSAITSEELGKAMFKAGIEGANHGILENIEIKKLKD